MTSLVIAPTLRPQAKPKILNSAGQETCNSRLFIFIPCIIFITFMFRLVHSHLKYFDKYSPCFNTALF
jgi:hypothetical protein